MPQKAVARRLVEACHRSLDQLPVEAPTEKHRLCRVTPLRRRVDAFKADAWTALRFSSRISKTAPRCGNEKQRRCRSRLRAITWL